MLSLFFLIARPEDPHYYQKDESWHFSKIWKFLIVSPDRAVEIYLLLGTVGLCFLLNIFWGLVLNFRGTTSAGGTRFLFCPVGNNNMFMCGVQKTGHKEHVGIPEKSVKLSSPWLIPRMFLRIALAFSLFLQLKIG